MESAQSDQPAGLREAEGRVKLASICLAFLVVAALDPLVPAIARHLPSLRWDDGYYHIQYQLLHPPKRATATEKRVVLVGSSAVGTDFDEVALARALSADTPVSVDNLGADAAQCLSAVILLDALRQLNPDVVVWAVDSWTFVYRNPYEWWAPQDTLMAREFGSGVLHRYVPDLPGRFQSLSQDTLIRNWGLFRYRNYIRRYLYSAPKAALKGPDAVFGPFRSKAAPPDPASLAAALRAAGQPQAKESAKEREGTVRLTHLAIPTAKALIEKAGGRLVVAWLPRPLDGEPHETWRLEAVRDACAAAGVPFGDLSGTVPPPGFNDTVHANRDGKAAATLALADFLKGLLPAAGKGPA